MHLPERLQPHLRELRRRHREDGARGTASFVAEKLRAQLTRRDTRIVILKRLDDIAVPARRGRVRSEQLKQRHLLALRELNRERGDLEGDARFAADLAAGHGGFVGFLDAKLVACYWWVDATMPRHRDMEGLGLGIELGPGDVYGYDLYVHKQHRAGGTVPDFLHQVESALHEQGFERLWGAVVADNRSARWTYEARGYVPEWSVERTRLLRRWRSRRVPIERNREGAAV
jgi:hypothetical protein